jgi:S-adenosylmethionine synthetase
MKFTIEQPVFIVEILQGKKTDRKCIRKFRREYPDSPVPTQSRVSKLVKKWRATGSVCDIKKQSKRIVLTEEKVRDIEARLQTNPRKSLGRLAKETGVSVGYAFRATKLFKFRPYKITVVHELTQQHYAA